MMPWPSPAAVPAAPEDLAAVGSALQEGQGNQPAEPVGWGPSDTSGAGGRRAPAGLPRQTSLRARF